MDGPCIVYLSLSRMVGQSEIVCFQMKKEIEHPTLSFPPTPPPFFLIPSPSSLPPSLPSSSSSSPYPSPSQDSPCNGKTSVSLFPIHPALDFEIKFLKVHHNLLKNPSVRPEEQVRTSEPGTKACAIWPQLLPGLSLCS